MSFRKLLKDEKKKRSVFLALNILLVLSLFTLNIWNLDLFKDSFTANVIKEGNSKYDLITGHAPRRISSPEQMGLDADFIARINSFETEISEACFHETEDYQMECIYLTKSLIAVGSQGKEDYVSERGCVGLMPLCDFIAQRKRFVDIFDKNGVTSCCDTLVCETKGCTPENDDRFVVKKNVRAGARYLMGLYQKYFGNVYLIALGFSYGEGFSDAVLRELSQQNENKEITLKRITDIISGLDKEEILRIFDAQKDAKIHDLDGLDVDVFRSEMNQFMEGVSKYYSFVSGRNLGSQPSFRDIFDNMGKYTINPAFSIYLDYDLDEFTKITEDAKELVETCSGGDDVQGCIDNTISDFGLGKVTDSDGRGLVREKEYTWNIGNCDPEIEVFEQFIEDFRLCLDSKSYVDDCTCNLKIESLPEGYHIELTKSHSITSEEILVISLIGKDGEKIASQSLDDTTLCYYNDRWKITNILGGKDAFKTDVEKIHVKQKGDSLILDDETGKLSWGNEGEISKILFKSSSGDVCFLPKSAEDNMINVEGLDRYGGATEVGLDEVVRCNSPKRYFRFCVESESSLFSGEEVQGLDDKVSAMKPVRYRFALYFKDNPPPKIRDLRVYDAPKDRNSMFVYFKESEAEDVEFYNIYYQNIDELEDEKQGLIESGDTARAQQLKEMDHLSVDEMREGEDLVETISVNKDDVAETYPESLVDFDCLFDYDEKKCRYDVVRDYSSITSRIFDFTPGNLYHFSGSGYYLYVVPDLIPEQNYKVGVTAEDVNGNELTNTLDESITIYSSEEAVVKDDLEFGKIPQEKLGFKEDKLYLEKDTLGTVSYLNYQTGEDMGVDSPTEYTILYYEIPEEVTRCPEDALDVESLGVYDIGIEPEAGTAGVGMTTLPTAEFSITLTDSNRYCVGIIAERNEIRDYGEEKDSETWREIKNLVTFVPSPFSS